MEQKAFDHSSEWGYKPNIDALRNPISEFNARGGMDLETFRALGQHLRTEHPTLGDETWAAIEAEIPTPELVEDPNTGQKLRVQKFNWPENGDVGDQVVTVSTMAFTTSLNGDLHRYQEYLMAKATGAPTVVFENPGYGESDKLTPVQKKALKEQGDFGPIAESMLGIATSLGVKQANLVGYSMGAETSAAIAAHAHDPKFGIDVRSLFVMEGPRIQPHQPVRLLRDFVSDNANLKFTWKYPFDPTTESLKKPKPQLPPRTTVAYGRTLWKSGLSRDLESALTTQPNMKLIIASAGTSKISPVKANNAEYDRLDEAFPGRVRRTIIPGEGHAYGDSGQRYANLAKLVLR